MTVRRCAGVLVALVPMVAVGLVTVSTPSAQGAVYCHGAKATILGGAAGGVLRGTSGPDVIVATAAVDEIHASRGNDTICAGGGDDVVFAGRGADRAYGGGGADIMFGEASSDLLNGGGGLDILLEGSDDDTVVGGGGLDLVGFLDSASAVTANLQTGRATGQGLDNFIDVEGLIGSNGPDVLSGDGGVNYLVGAGGDDTLQGRGGPDFVMYTLSAAGVSIDMTGHVAMGEGADTLASIENVVGSPFDDWFMGGAGDDFFVGAEGADSADGAGGTNTCFAESVVNCKTILPTSDTLGEEPPGPPAGSPAARSEGIPPIELSRLSTPQRRDGAGGVSCHPFNSTVSITFPSSLPGQGVYAFRFFHPFSGWEAWSYSLYVYNQNGLWWAWYNNQWVRVLDTDERLGGADLPVEVQYYSYATQTWYLLGRCTTRGMVAGISGEWVFTGG